MCVPDLHSGDALGRVLSPPGTETQPAVFHNVSHSAAVIKLLRDFGVVYVCWIFLEAKYMDYYHV